MELFRELELEEQQEFVQWARDNYKPGEEINGVWHPIVQSECVRMNEEQFGTGRAKSANPNEANAQIEVDELSEVNYDRIVNSKSNN